MLASNLFYEFETLFFSLDGILLTTLFLALYETGRGWLILKDVLCYWFLIVPCVATAILYALVYYSHSISRCLFCGAVAVPVLQCCFYCCSSGGPGCFPVWLFFNVVMFLASWVFRRCSTWSIFIRGTLGWPKGHPINR